MLYGSKEAESSFETSPSPDLGFSSRNQELITYQELLESKGRLNNRVSVKIIKIVDDIFPDATIYNGALFLKGDSLALTARVERLDDEISTVRNYIFNGDTFIPDQSIAPRQHLQDPCLAYSPEHELIQSSVQTFSSKKDPKKILGYRDVLYQADNPDKILARGPFGQKGLKVFYHNDQYVIIVRQRQETMIDSGRLINSSSHAMKVGNIGSISPSLVREVFAKSETKIRGFFAQNEWGNVADGMLLLADGRIGFMGHIAKYLDNHSPGCSEPDRAYSIIVGILDPHTLHVDEVKMILTAADVTGTYKDISPKRLDLMNVVYSRSMGIRIDTNLDNQRALSLVGCCGVGDRYTAVFETQWPFSVQPDFNAPTNHPFVYPSHLLNQLFVNKQVN